MLLLGYSKKKKTRKNLYNHYFIKITLKNDEMPRLATQQTAPIVFLKVGGDRTLTFRNPYY